MVGSSLLPALGGLLDCLTRWDLQDVLVEVWNRTRVTAVCVTHDVDEAILLADRVVMMTNGPFARIGKVMTVELPRPRLRREVLEFVPVPIERPRDRVKHAIALEAAQAHLGALLEDQPSAAELVA